MKLAVKTAWMGGTGLFLLVTYTSIFRHVDLIDVLQGKRMLMEPMTVLLLSAGGGMLGSIIGYWIGDILSKPRGKKKLARTGKGPKSARASGRAKKEEVSTPITGDETFLDDLESPDTPQASPTVEAYAPSPSDDDGPKAPVGP